MSERCGPVQVLVGAGNDLTNRCEGCFLMLKGEEIFRIAIFCRNSSCILSNKIGNFVTILIKSYCILSLTVLRYLCKRKLTARERQNILFPVILLTQRLNSA
jgi:hypothetical protein